jgi:hypothetical protein
MALRAASADAHAARAVVVGQPRAATNDFSRNMPPGTERDIAPRRCNSGTSSPRPPSPMN